MNNVASFHAFLIALLIYPSSANSQLTIDATGPIPENQRVVRSGRFGLGRKVPLRIAIRLQAGPARADDSGIVEFTLVNSGKNNLSIPVSVNPTELAPSDPKADYSVNHLGLYLTSDKRQETVLRGGAQLYGNRSSTGTMVQLAPGDSIRVLAKVTLKSEPASQNSRVVFVAHVVLNEERIKQVNAEAIMDSQEIAPRFWGVEFSSEPSPNNIH